MNKICALGIGISCCVAFAGCTTMAGEGRAQGEQQDLFDEASGGKWLESKRVVFTGFSVNKVITLHRHTGSGEALLRVQVSQTFSDGDAATPTAVAIRTAPNGEVIVVDCELDDIDGNIGTGGFYSDDATSYCHLTGDVRDSLLHADYIELQIQTDKGRMKPMALDPNRIARLQTLK